MLELRISCIQIVFDCAVLPVVSLPVTTDPTLLQAEDKRCGFHGYALVYWSGECHMHHKNYLTLLLDSG